MIKKLESMMKWMLLLVMVGSFAMPSATAIANLVIGLDNYGAGEIANQTFKFVLQQNLPADGKIKIVYPEGFNIQSAHKNASNPYLNYSSGYEAYNLIIDAPNRTLIIHRNGADSAISKGEEVWLYLDNIKNPNMIGSKTITVYTTLNNDVFVETGSAKVAIIAGPATHLTFETIADPQVAGKAFPITVKALDQFGNIDTGYSLTDSLNSSIGTISPNTIDIISGTGTVGITLTSAGRLVNIKAIDPVNAAINGTSNNFAVKPAALDSIELADISDQFDELAFTVTAQAKDVYGNIKTDYNAINNLTVNPGVPGTVTIVSPVPATVQFVNGTFSGHVMLNVTPNPTPNALQKGVNLTITNVTLDISGTSNEFNISLPVDLKNSTVVAVPMTVIEDNKSTSTITVTVKNGINQQNISGATVVLTSDRGNKDTIKPSSNTTDSNGQAIFSISSSNSGKANITAKVWGTELEQKPVVTFGFDELLHLVKDWNLVSVPRQLANRDISALGATNVDRIYYYDAGKQNWTYAIYNRTSGTWSGTLTGIDDGKGYWMFASAAGNVPVSLKSIDPMQVPPAYPIKAGWNLIGYTSMQLKLSSEIYDYFYPDLYYSTLSTFSPKWVAVYEWTGSGFDQATPQGGFEEVMRTRGYWVYLKDDATLVP